MISKRFNVPVLLLIFNRIETVREVIGTVKKQSPTFLYIAADGPRTNHPGEKEKCDDVRKFVLDSIDWNCEVKTLFREANLGCGRSVSEAITWFFENVEQGIILEDDCLPNEAFFRFCEINLEKYQDNPRISIVSGNNFHQSQPILIDSDYYFSIFPSTWGWATWRRTWKDYDINIKAWQTIDKRRLLRSLFDEKSYRKFWKNIFDDFLTGNEVDTWDFQFYFLCMRRNQLAIIPKANLVSNIGHGTTATHTTSTNGYFANLPTYELNFPLKHPENIERNREADLFVQKILFGEAEVVSPINKMKRWTKRIIRYNK